MSLFGVSSGSRIARFQKPWWLLVFAAAIVQAANPAGGAAVSAVKSGEWTASDTWSSGQVPGNDTVTIANGYEVTFSGTSNSTTGSILLTPSEASEADGTGTLTINTTGSLTLTGYLHVGRTSPVGGTLNLQNGALSVGGSLAVGMGGVGTVNQTGGTLRWTGTTTFALAAGSSTLTGGTGTYNLSGGVVEGNAPGVAISVLGLGANNSYSGDSLIHQTGGILRASDIRYYSRAGCTAKYELEGGDLWANTLSATGSGATRGTYSLVWAGGTLHPYSADVSVGGLIETVLNTGSSPNTINTLDKDGVARTVTLNTSISGSGGLDITGGGNVTLAGQNTYTGDTTLDASSLTLAEGASLAFDINATGDSTQLLGNGSLTLNGTLAFDLTDAAYGDWNVIAASLIGAGTYGDTFGVTFTFGSETVNALETDGVWTYTDSMLGTATFTEATGVLSLAEPVATVPEPNTLVLLAVSMVGLLAFDWHRRK